MAFLSSSFHSAKSYERHYFQYERSPLTTVSLFALRYEPSDRILSLARPKIRRETTIREGFSRYISNPRYSGVTEAAALARCSSRLSDLALPLKRFKSHQYELNIPRPVSSGALRYNASERINELAKPKKLPGVV